MKRSEHEAIVREHLSALAWANNDKTRLFVAHLAGLFGIFDAEPSAMAAAQTVHERAAFLAEHRRFHRHRPKRRALISDNA